ncbi:Myelin-associated oligodendrocyte basic protein isoform 1 [Rhynchospora pubera]|uniref:Myelin-associated oligodendrocyte basic protein isoform 1 n=1 Tax=Rhynchospora pubera TaxID=906938 RepID=A0AAV8CK31_9POAL|nr:Myelin-associated oligodendrocyte basic protein isoform 1 [Rhynchospora pubera]
MELPSSSYPLARKSMALVLILVLIVLLSHNAAAASGGAMGGGFSSARISKASYSTSTRSRYTYSTPYTTYVYRDSCCGSRRTYTLLHQNGMEERDMRVFFIAVLVSGVMITLLLAYFDKNRSMPSVIKLQVALKGQGCSLQQDLNDIALKADTSTQEGYKYVLQESARTLLRNSEYWLLSYLSEQTKCDENQAENLFYELFFEERSKFDEETLVNIDNHQEQKRMSDVSTSSTPFIVVNVILATAGPLKLSPINTATDLKAILQKLGGLAKREILAAHVLWTPQDENDHLSAERVFQDYPLLTEFKDKLD